MGVEDPGLASTIFPQKRDAEGLGIRDLSQDRLLASVKRVQFQKREVPSLGGVFLLSKLGQGAMGAVYYGVHSRLNIEVAVKILPAKDLDEDSASVARFFREAQIAASIQSPHLVGVRDINNEAGLYFIVMEFVLGKSAGQCLREARNSGLTGLPENIALEICIAASRGLRSAHAKGIVHRDIKPDNILIPGSDGLIDLKHNESKLADLGLARGDDMAKVLTGTHAMMGSPGFMAPEQYEDAKRASKPADVFGMGATLYALLAGTAPFSGDTLTRVMLDTMNTPHAPIHWARPNVSEATGRIINRCLEKDPAKRFEDAKVLMEELKKAREGLEQNTRRPQKLVEPNQALDRKSPVRENSKETNPLAIGESIPTVRTWSKQAKWRALIFRFIGGWFLFTLGLMLFWSYLNRIGPGEPNHTEANSLPDSAPTDSTLAPQSKEISTQGLPRPEPPRIDFDSDPPTNGVIEPVVTVSFKHTESVRCVAFSPDSKTLATGSDDKFIRLWDLAAGKEVRKLNGHEFAVTSVAFSPDGLTLASGSWDKTLRLWDVATGNLRNFEGHWDAICSVVFSPDGRTLASGSLDHTVRLWEVHTGKELIKFDGHGGGISSVAFSPDGQILAAGNDDTTIQLWDVGTGKELHKLEGHRDSVTSIAFSPDGLTLASGSWDQTIRLWEVGSGKEKCKFERRDGWIFSVAFSPDGKTVAAGGDRTIRLWDVSSGMEYRIFDVHDGMVNSVTFSPDGRSLASGHSNNAAHIWDLSPKR